MQDVPRPRAELLLEQIHDRVELLTDRVHVLTAAVAVVGVLAVVAIGWLIWITTDPGYWFPGAYADHPARGERGPPGQPGPRGFGGRKGLRAAQARIYNLS